MLTLNFGMLGREDRGLMMLGEVKSSNLSMPTIVKHLLGTSVLHFFSFNGHFYSFCR